MFDTECKEGYIYAVVFQTKWGMRWPSWFRHCATSRKVAGSILDDVIGIFHWHNSSGCTMALGSTHLLTEGCRYLRLTLPFSFADYLDVLEPQPPGTLWVCNRAVLRSLYFKLNTMYVFRKFSARFMNILKFYVDYVELNSIVNIY